MEKVVKKLEETVLCLNPLVMDPVFYPFTRPVLYGKQEDIAFKNGPSLQNILENDLTTKNQVSEISKTLQESFDMSSKHLENLDETRKNYHVNETTDLEKYLSDNPNIDFFRSFLAVKKPDPSPVAQLFISLSKTFDLFFFFNFF